MKLNFGCGYRPLKDFYNVDIIRSEGVDKSFDFNVFPYPLKDNQFDYILCKQVLEHCSYPKKVLLEFRRICKDKAIIDIEVPYVNSRSALSHLEHCSFFNRWSFLHLNGEDKYDLTGNSVEKFKVIENKIKPCRFLAWVPKGVLDIISSIFNNVYVQINAKIEVVKNE